MSIAYGQKALTPGSITIYTVGSNVGWVVIQNESPYSLQVSIDGTGSTRTIAAQVMDKLPIPSSGFNGNIVLMPVIVLTNYTNAPSFAVLLDAFGKDEEPEGTYPVALSRAVQIAGNVNAVTTTTNGIDNEGNPAGTNIIKSIVSGDGTNLAVSLTNDAQMTLGDTLHAALLAIVGSETISGGLTVNSEAFFAGVQMFGLLQMIGASIQLDNAQSILFKDNGGTVRPVIGLSNTNKVIISGAAQFVEFRNQSGTVIMSLDLTNSILQFPQGGMTIAGSSLATILTSSVVNSYLNGSTSSNLQAGGTTILNCLSNGINCQQRINFSINGGLTSMSNFTGTGTTTGVAHGLGTTPDFIAISCTQAGSTATFGYSALTTTTCTITAGASVTWKATAFKF